MSATKQDYKAVAAALCAEIDASDRRLRPDIRRDALRMVSHKIADHFAKNPKFSREEFLCDCGVQS